MKHKVNAFELGKIAKVLLSTVSSVLNNYPFIKVETRKKYVLQSMN